MSKVSNEIVYGWFVYDNKDLLATVDASELNDNDVLLKCIYVGRTERGLEVRSKEHKLAAYREYKKNGELYDEYYTTKYVLYRQLESEGYTIYKRKLCDLVDGDEEYVEYVKFLVGGHPVANEKFGDRYKTYKDELDVLLKDGELKSSGEFNAKVKELVHTAKMNSDVDYAEKEKRRLKRQAKEMITHLLRDKLRDWDGIRRVRLGRWVEFTQTEHSISCRILTDKFREYREYLKMVVTPIQRENIALDIDFWNNFYVDDDRLKTRTVVDVALEKIPKRFETFDEFRNSIGLFSNGVK